MKDAFFSLKINKIPGYGEISFNVVKKCFRELYDPLKFIIELSLEKGIFPDDLKLLELLLFSKVVTVLNWETIDQYQRICKYLQENKLLYPKQFGFQFGHSTDHAIIQFVDQIFEAFENNLYTLGVFIGLSKSFQKPLTHYYITLRCLLYGGGQNKWGSRRFLLYLINGGDQNFKKSVNIGNE